MGDSEDGEGRGGGDDVGQLDQLVVRHRQSFQSLHVRHTCRDLPGGVGKRAGTGRKEWGGEEWGGAQAKRKVKKYIKRIFSICSSYRIHSIEV